MLNSKRVLAGIIGAVLGLATLYGAYRLGRHEEHKTVYWSELLTKVNLKPSGSISTYFMDYEIVCANGKDLGRLQVDFNLETGKLKIVRNDPQLYIDCKK